MKPQWVVNVRPQAKPTLSNRSTKVLEEELFNFWAEHVSFSESLFWDRELFLEDAYRLKSAFESFGKENIWLRFFTKDKADFITNALTKETKPFSEDYGYETYGMIPGTFERDSSAKAASNYFFTETFQRNAGRVVTLTGLETGDTDISVVAEKMFKEQGVTNFFVKYVESKKGIFSFTEFDQGKDKSIRNYFENSFLYLTGAKNVENILSLQEHVEMNHEYRIFVIDNKMVTGAGMVASFCPVDNDNVAFDTKTIAVKPVRKVLSHEEEWILSEMEVEEEPFPPECVSNNFEAVNELLTFAEKVIKEFKDEVPIMTDYVLDVTFIKGKPSIVELNSLSNAGFYACQPALITDALQVKALRKLS